MKTRTLNTLLSAFCFLVISATAYAGNGNNTEAKQTVTDECASTTAGSTTNEDALTCMVTASYTGIFTTCPTTCSSGNLCRGCTQSLTASWGSGCGTMTSITWTVTNTTTSCTKTYTTTSNPATINSFPASDGDNITYSVCVTFGSNTICSDTETATAVACD